MSKKKETSKQSIICNGGSAWDPIPVKPVHTDIRYASAHSEIMRPVQTRD